MTRLFLDNSPEEGEIITLDKDASRYLTQVLRMREGETLVAVFKDKTEALCGIYDAFGKQVRLKIGSVRANISEPPCKITLYQSVSKGERMDLTIQKCVELGVFKIVPVFSMRCVVKADAPAKQGIKTSRRKKISLEAARQSGRGIVPEVCEPVLFEDAVKAAKKENDLILFPWEEEGTLSLKQALKDRVAPQNIAVFIGPEGGYDESEAELARANGALTVTLGKRILRTETAGAAVLAMLLYHFEL